MSLPEPDHSSVALITGASAGLGYEFARQLSERGHRVARERKSARHELIQRDPDRPYVAARIYRVGILMYGKRPTLPEIMKWIRYA